MTKELVAQLFIRETDRVLEPIPRALERTMGEFVERGVARSGMYVAAVREIAVGGLRDLVSQRVEIEKKVWGHQAKKPSKEDAETCKATITSDIETVAPRFFWFVENQCGRVGYKDLIAGQSEEFHSAKAKFIKDAHREIDIWIGLSEIEPEKPPVSTVHITYNLQGYGILQVGPQSHAIISAGEAKENQWIIDALSEVRGEITRLKELQLEQRTGLIGAIDTAIEEVRKERPNPLTIGGIITAVGSATSVLANATKAYETVRAVAGHFGITLPLGPTP